MVFKIDLMPAREGDAIWITYGQAGALHNVLIDAGRQATAAYIQNRIDKLPTAKKRFELVVVTHIDRDHVEGMIKLLEDDFNGAKVDDFWFNGYDHLFLAAELERMGGVMGERLSNEIARLGLPWNKSFDDGPVVIPDGPVVKTLPGGLQLTILSPTPQKLAELIPDWEDECKKAGIHPGGQTLPADAPPEEDEGGIDSLGAIDLDSLIAGKFKSDTATPNGSSIAMIAEYDGKRILLGADAHCDVLQQGLESLAGEGGRYKLAAFKLPHHGSRANISPEVLDLVTCKRFLVSTNGSYFNHPDQVAIARVIRGSGPRTKIIFNYRSDETSVWDDVDLGAQEKFSVEYPPADADGAISITL